MNTRDMIPSSWLPAALLKKVLLPGVLLLSGCSTVTRHHQDDLRQVELSPGVSVQLPLPAALGDTLTASQLIQASWSAQGEKQTRQLPVRLQVTPDQIVLAGFSSWGTRLLSLTYKVSPQGAAEIQTEILPGLETKLPKPEQILLNLMLTLWPRQAWESALQPIHWHIVDHENQRIISDNQGKRIIIIYDDIRQPLHGNIQFRHLNLGYEIDIKTMHYQKQNIKEQQ